MPYSSHPHALERRDAAAWGARHHFRLPALESAAADARRRTRHQLHAWGSGVEVLDTAQLVISELVTNALRHTATTWIGCELALSGSLLRVAVSSEGAGPRHEPGPAGEDDEGGRGLLLVVTLAEGWGVRPDGSGLGHTVWADLPLGADRL